MLGRESHIPGIVPTIFTILVLNYSIVHHIQIRIKCDLNIYFSYNYLISENNLNDSISVMQFLCIYLNGFKITTRFSKNHRMLRVGRDL